MKVRLSEGLAHVIHVLNRCQGGAVLSVCDNEDLIGVRAIQYRR